MITVPDAKLPYPRSRVIHGFEFVNKRRCMGHGDNWALTWADDGEHYAFVTDGKAFSNRKKQVSTMPVRISGPADDPTGRDIDSPTGTIPYPGGQKSPKVSGLVMIGGVLYAWLRNLNPAGRPEGTGSCLTVSTDHARTWERLRWAFPGIGYPSWLNAGQDYGAARDGYAYFISPDTPSAYADEPAVLMGRVPVDRIRDEAAYAFFGGLDDAGGPRWVAFAERRPVLHDSAGCFRTDLVYNPGLGRYLLLSASPSGDWSDWWANDNPDRVPHLGIFEAPEPWGPWRTVAYIEDWGAPENRFTPHIAPGWISDDGTTFELIFSCLPKGRYEFNWQRCRVQHTPGAEEAPGHRERPPGDAAAPPPD